MKRIVSAAAVAAGLSISMAALNAGSAYSAPLDPPPPCPNCQGGGGVGGGGGGSIAGPGVQAGGGAQAGGGVQVPQNPPQTTQAPATQSQAPATQSTEAPATSTQAPATQTTQAPATSTQAPATQTTQAPATQTTQSGAQTTSPSAQTTAPASGQTTTPQLGGEAYASLNAPSTQPEHPPYIPPRGVYASGNAQVGGPVDLDTGFSIVGHGAPTPPRQHGYGWNDGRAPGHPPPYWEGPPPLGGWDGPPPPGGWNRPWAGAPRDVAVARADFGAFSYNTFTVTPVFNWQYGGWGYWYFGVWVPLY
ncbi:MAP_0585 family protein [Mycobacterium sp.]|uniref:MAP_0585 family protein n=1 Tax=Mycobacterium sp. TaxID=1785 RepID=UPI0025F18C43|nr:MAP_0585 family protein [Mycobacterium sp.]